MQLVVEAYEKDEEKIVEENKAIANTIRRNIVEMENSIFYDTLIGVEEQGDSVTLILEQCYPTIKMKKE